MICLRSLSTGARGALRSHAISPRLLQIAPWQATASRSPLSTSAIWRTSTQSHTEADARNDRRHKEEDIDAKKTAQRLVDDRPWHREDSHSQPESTSSDPSGHDRNKGKLPLWSGFRQALTYRDSREITHHANTASQAYPAYALPPGTATHQSD